MTRPDSRTVLPRGEVIIGDATAELAKLPEASADMVLTSPPYFRLRDYAVTGQLGLELTVNDWVGGLRDVAREIARVLVPSGSFWLNVGDTYSTGDREGAARKSLLLGPERLALALLEDGWRLRNKIVWQKANTMPSSVTDRLTCSWEALLVFVRADRYFFDLDAIRAPHTSTPPKHQRPRLIRTKRAQWLGPNTDDATGLARMKASGRVGHPLGKNPGDVWRIPASNYRGSHHATFPVALAELAVRAGCPEQRCTACRTPYRRPVHRQVVKGIGETAVRGALTPQCDCAADAEPGIVLDPFFGAGTTALGAIENHRDWLGIELSPHFAREARERIAGYQPANQRAAEPTDDEHPGQEAGSTLRRQDGATTRRETGTWAMRTATAPGPAPRRCHATYLSDHVTLTQSVGRTRTEEVTPMSNQDMTQEPSQKNGSVKTLAIRLDPATHAQLSLIAQLRGTTLTDEIRSALDAHLANAKDAPELAAHADQALADLEADMATRRAAIANLFGTDAPTEPETRTRATGRTGGAKG